MTGTAMDVIKTMQGEHPGTISESKRAKFEELLQSARSSKRVGIDVSCCLLKNGPSFSSEIASTYLSQLISASYSSAGLGKGIFEFTMFYLPELEARTYLQHWINDEAMFDVSAVHSGLVNAFQNNRFSLASDLMDLSTTTYGIVSTAAAISTVDTDKLVSARYVWESVAANLVDNLCFEKSFSRALLLAGEREDLKASVMRSVGSAFGAKPAQSGSWVSLMNQMFHFTGNDTDSIETEILIERHRNAAITVIEQVMLMPFDDLSKEADTDQLRIMAMKLGRHELTKKLETAEGKGKSIEMDFLI